MRIDIHHHYHYHSELAKQIQSLIIKFTKMSEALDQLRAEVAESNTVTLSAITLIKGIKTQLDEAIANNNVEALKELSAQLDTQQSALSQAISENTPGGPTTPEEPTIPEIPATPGTDQPA